PFCSGPWHRGGPDAAGGPMAALPLRSCFAVKGSVAETIYGLVAHGDGTFVGQSASLHPLFRRPAGGETAARDRIGLEARIAPPDSKPAPESAICRWTSPEPGAR